MKRHHNFLSQPCGDTARRWLCISEEERSHQKGFLILNFTNSRTVRNDYLLFNSPSLWEFHYSSLSWLKGFLEPLGWNRCPYSVLSRLSVDVLCNTYHSWYYAIVELTAQSMLSSPRSSPRLCLFIVTTSSTMTSSQSTLDKYLLNEFKEVLGKSDALAWKRIFP